LKTEISLLRFLSFTLVVILVLILLFASIDEGELNVP